VAFSLPLPHGTKFIVDSARHDKAVCRRCITHAHKENRDYRPGRRIFPGAGARRHRSTAVTLRCLYMHICMYVCTYMYMCIYLYVYICICIYVCRSGEASLNCRNTSLPVYVNMYICIYVHMYMYMCYICIYVYMYMFICLIVCRSGEASLNCRNTSLLV